MMEDFASAVLYQDHIAVVLLLIAGGFLIKLLPFRFPKAFGNSKMFAFVNFVAAIVILVGALNLGYKLSDDDWGRNSVNKQKQETINKLQQDLARRR